MIGDRPINSHKDEPFPSETESPVQVFDMYNPSANVDTLDFVGSPGQVKPIIYSQQYEMTRPSETHEQGISHISDDALIPPGSFQSTDLTVRESGDIEKSIPTSASESSSLDGDAAAGGVSQVEAGGFATGNVSQIEDESIASKFILEPGAGQTAETSRSDQYSRFPHSSNITMQLDNTTTDESMRTLTLDPNFIDRAKGNETSTATMNENIPEWHVSNITADDSRNSRENTTNRDFGHISPDSEFKDFEGPQSESETDASGEEVDAAARLGRDAEGNSMIEITDVGDVRGVDLNETEVRLPGRNTDNLTPYLAGNELKRDGGLFDGLLNETSADVVSDSTIKPFSRNTTEDGHHLSDEIAQEVKGRVDEGSVAHAEKHVLEGLSDFLPRDHIMWVTSLIGLVSFWLVFRRRRSIRPRRNCCCTDFVQSAKPVKIADEKSSGNQLNSLMGELHQQLQDVSRELAVMRSQRDSADHALIEASTSILLSLNEHIADLTEARPTTS